MHLPCCPPEVHVHTGRLLLGRVRLPAVPRRHRSYAALRLPRLLRLAAPVVPRQRPTSCGAFLGRLARAPQRASVGDWSPGLRGSGFFEERQGPPRLPGHPLRACRRQSPRSVRPPLPRSLGEQPLSPSRINDPWAPGMRRFRGHLSTAHSFAHLRIAGVIADIVARLASGWAGHPWPGGFRTRWLTIQNFMKSSHPSFLSDRHGLVARQYRPHYYHLR